MTDITVVKIEDASAHSRLPNTWCVYFSEPVHLRDLGTQIYWFVDTQGGSWLQLDELGAYLWGLDVIEKHKERIRAERARHNRG